MMFALLLGALSLGACVDDSETQSVTDVRNAKAEQLKAAADLATAQAEAAKTQADAQKALAEAQAEFQKAQAEAAKIAAEAEAAKAKAEAALKQAEADKLAAQNEADKAVAEAKLQQALAEAEQAKAEAEAAKKKAELDAAKYMADMEKLKWETESEIAKLEKEVAEYKQQAQNSNDTRIQTLITNYANAISKLNDFKSTLIKKQYDLAKLESDFATAEEDLQKSIADEEKLIAGYQNEIEAWKEFKGYDLAKINEEIKEKQQQMKFAVGEFNASDVCATLVAASETIEKAIEEAKKQKELVDKVNPSIFNMTPESYGNIENYSVVTYDFPQSTTISRGNYYKDVTVNEAQKTAEENRLARNTKYFADVLGTPEDSEDKQVIAESDLINGYYYYHNSFTKYAVQAQKQKAYDEAAAEVEKAKGVVSEKAEALKEPEQKFFDAEKALDEATEARDKAVEAVNDANAAITKAVEDRAAADLALQSAQALPDTNKDKEALVRAAKDAQTKADADKTAGEAALDAAEKDRDAKQAALVEKTEERNTAETAYNAALNEKNQAERELKNAEDFAVMQQDNLNRAKQNVADWQKMYDDAVKDQKEFADAVAAVDVKAVNAAATALEDAIKAHEEANDAYEEAKEPIEKMDDEISVLEKMIRNDSGVVNVTGENGEIATLEGKIADSQEKIEGYKNQLANIVENGVTLGSREALIEQKKAEITQLEQQIETQTGIVENAKAALDAALAE